MSSLLSKSLANSPAGLQPEVLLNEWQNKWQRLDESLLPEARTFLESEGEEGKVVTGQESVSEQWKRVMLGSHFACDFCCAHPDRFWQMLSGGALFQSQSPDYFERSLKEQVSSVTTEAELKSILRINRQKEMFRIIWRDLNRLSHTEETCRDLSALADASIRVALFWLSEHQAQEFGGQPSWCPPGASQEQSMDLLVLGLGKLGGGELNLSSDIDLMFVYPEQGTLNTEKKTISYQEYFIRLGVKLIAALDQKTVDGFVFRVDMRLRPYGQSGALVMGFTALENYYHEQGREWERYAMIKARVVTGSGWAKLRLKTLISQFVYRRYIDYGVIESLRELKRMIHQDVLRRGLQNNVKLGDGGIREIEFIAQSYQLALGGRDPLFQERRLLIVLDLLASNKQLDLKVCEKLKTAYFFLRDVEHILQAIADQQTQQLPNDEKELSRVAYLMKEPSVDAFMDKLDKTRQLVKFHFDNVVADPIPADGVPDDVESSNEPSFLQQKELLVNFWNGQALTAWPDKDEACLKTLHELLDSFRRGHDVKKLKGIGQERLDRFMPLLLHTVLSHPKSETVMLRVLPLLESVVRRSVYLVLLTENPKALAQLVLLFEACPWIADLITQTPVLMDELLDDRSLYQPPDRGGLTNELQQQFIRVDNNDLEYVMDRLRQFVKGHCLRVAAAEVTEVLPLTKVSDYLTFIADVTLQSLLSICWQQMVEKHGVPTDELGPVAEPQMLIVGYGKLGGIELSYGSDLDLVLIHNAQSKFMTDGENPIDNQMFYTRLGQRFVHMLGVRTQAGVLYEVDLRLRPNGASGLMVATLNGFEKYQKQNAWTWEHQALVRARVVAGPEALSQSFAKIRAEVLSKNRDQAQLRKDVRDMREKMRVNLGTKDTKKAPELIKACAFDIKQDAGGIVDIEFMVQYGVLAWSHSNHQLLQYTDNIRLLEILSRLGLLPPSDCQLLRDAYIAYRSMVHRLALQKQPTQLDESALAESGFNAYRHEVRRIWDSLLGCSDDVEPKD